MLLGIGSMVTSAVVAGTNTNGVTYNASITIGPSAYGDANKSINGEFINLALLTAGNAVVYTFQSPTVAFFQPYADTTYTYQYVGDGTGDYKVRVSSSTSTFIFHAAVDDVTITLA